MKWNISTPVLDELMEDIDEDDLDAARNELDMIEGQLQDTFPDGYCVELAITVRKTTS